MLSLSSNYKAAQCGKNLVRRMSKSRIDLMYYLTDMERKREVLGPTEKTNNSIKQGYFTLVIKSNFIIFFTLTVLPEPKPVLADLT